MSNKAVLFFIPLVVWNTLGWSSEPLKLSTAYQLALKSEPHLRSMAFKTAATAEGVSQTQAKLYPQLQGTASFGRYEYEYTTSRNDPVKETYSSYSLSATQPLFHPELWRGVDEAKARQKSAEYEFQAQAQKLGLDLAKAYFALLYAQRNVDLIASHKAYYETKYKQLEEMLKFGLSNRIDLLETKVHKDQSTAEWLNEKKRLQVAKLKLEHLIGQTVTELYPFDFTEIDTEKLMSTRQEWEGKITANPKLLAAVSAEEMARHQVAVREYEHYPKVDLSLTRKETYTEDTIAHKYDNQAVAQMTIPIFQGGFTQSRVREGRLLLDSASKDLDYYRQETLYGFEELWAQRELSIESIEVLKESTKSAELYLQSVEKGHAAGLKSLVDVLEAKAKLYDVRRKSVEAGFQLVNNQLGLLDVSGELNVEKISEFEKLVSLPSVHP